MSHANLLYGSLDAHLMRGYLKALFPRAPRPTIDFHGKEAQEKGSAPGHPHPSERNAHATAPRRRVLSIGRELRAPASLAQRRIEPSTVLFSARYVPPPRIWNKARLALDIPNSEFNPARSRLPPYPLFSGNRDVRFHAKSPYFNI